MAEKIDPNQTGAFLAALRKAKGMTQAQVAEALCVSNKTVSKWESGGGLPDVTVLPDLAEFYGVTVDDLLSGGRQSREAAPPAARKKHWQRLYRRAEMRLMTLGVCMVSLPLLGLVAAEASGYASRKILRYLQTEELLVLLCAAVALVVLWYQQRILGESLEAVSPGAARRITVVGHRLLLLVPLVSILCLRTDWARRLTDWRKAPQAWSSVTLWHFAYLTIVIACGLVLWLLCRVCRRAGGNLLGRVGSRIFGLIYGGCFLCAGSTFGACLCGDILYSDRMNQSHKKERQIIALINQTGGKWVEILLLALVIGLALYTLFRLEEDPRKS